MLKRETLDAPFWIRWAAKIVVKWMHKQNCSNYQISGKLNWFYDSKIDSEVRNKFGNKQKHVDIQAESFGIYHWILRCCGYSVCEADVMKWRGVKNVDLKLKWDEKKSKKFPKKIQRENSELNTHY